MDVQENSEVLKYFSNAPPAHYLVQVNSFSLLDKNSVERYESGTFEVGGCNWKLIVYPKGNTSKNAKEHISLYLALEGTSSLPPGWEIYVIFRFFLLDQNNDKYLVVQDSLGKGRRFHKMKSEWGFDKFIPLSTFNEGSNGYLVNDACIFGAEVFVCRERSTGKGESLVMMKDAITYNHFWLIENFSKLQQESYSRSFTAGNHKWKIQFYPKGKGTGLESHLSLYLALAEPSTLPPSSKIYADVSLRILDLKQRANDLFVKVKHWFSASSYECGWARFTSLSTFTSTYWSYLQNDRCWVEAEITILGLVDVFSK